MSKDILKAERLKVLELLAQGKINAEDAAKLLDALSEGSEESASVSVIKNDKKMPFKMLKIYVDSNDGDKVRVSNCF